MPVDDPPLVTSFLEHCGAQARAINVTCSHVGPPLIFCCFTTTLLFKHSDFVSVNRQPDAIKFESYSPCLCPGTAFGTSMIPSRMRLTTSSY
jgi:hypothetical protein